MKHTIKTTFLLFFICSIGLYSSEPHSNKRIAVVKSMYDKIGNVLKAYRIPFELIQYQELEKKDIFSRYKSIYFPSGMEPPMYKNIKLFSRGTKIKSVALKKSFHGVNKNKIIDNIKEFVDKGGSAYFSGYSYKFLQKAYNPFQFFRNFAYMGLPGRVISNLKNDLKRFSKKDTAALYMNYQGWIAIKNARDSEIIAEARFETPAGEKKGPISLILPRGEGEVIYTSYYSSVFSDFRRFNVFRIAGAELLKYLAESAKAHEQVVTGKIVDSIIDNENFRIYRLNLIKGDNTIYFLSDNNYYQIDIFNSDMNLMISSDRFKKEQLFDMKSKNDDICYIKIYPSANKRYGRFAFLSGSGTRVFPHQKKIIISALILLSAIFIFVIIWLFRGRKYSYRSKLINRI